MVICLEIKICNCVNMSHSRSSKNPTDDISSHQNLVNSCILLFFYIMRNEIHIRAFLLLLNLKNEISCL